MKTYFRCLICGWKTKNNYMPTFSKHLRDKHPEIYYNPKRKRARDYLEVMLKRRDNING